MKSRAIERFLKGPNIARVATLRRDGWPVVVPTWYEWDGKFCYLVGRKKSSWVENIRREPRVTVLVDSEKSPNPKVTIEGRATIVGSRLSDWIEIGKKMVKRYYGSEAGMSYLEGSLDQPRYTIKVTPIKITSWVDPEESELAKNPKSSWHPRYYEPGSRWEKEYLRERELNRKRHRNLSLSVSKSV